MKRAGFGGCPQDVAKLTERGLNSSVDWYVDYENLPDNTPAPDWAHPEDPEALAALRAIQAESDPVKKQMLVRQRRQEENELVSDLRYWWLKRMADGPRPLQEKLTLFWHGHFATSFEKVRSPYNLWQQNEIFRKYATAPFFDLLCAVSKDPAMLIYLDGATSKKDHPNENFAREVMELFTLGEGHYTEKDIQESARAYTGWTLAPGRQAFRYAPQNHDDGEKVFLGRRGNFTGEDCLEIIAAQRQTSVFIAQKLWRFFVQDPAPQEHVDALAEVLASNQMDLKETMRTLLRSEAFYSPDVIRGQVKSPVQWLVSAVRELQSPMPTLPMAIVMLNVLGQDLFQPPNVKGWDGNYAWITTSSLLNRYNLSSALVEGTAVPIAGVTGRIKGLAKLTDQLGGLEFTPVPVTNLFSQDELCSPQKLIDAMQKRLLNAPLQPKALSTLTAFLQNKSTTLPLQEEDVRKVLRLVMSTPDYQLT